MSGNIDDQSTARSATKTRRSTRILLSSSKQISVVSILSHTSGPLPYETWKIGRNSIFDTKATSSDAARQFQTECLRFSLLSCLRRKSMMRHRDLVKSQHFCASRAPVNIRLGVKYHLMASSSGVPRHQHCEITAQIAWWVVIMIRDEERLCGHDGKSANDLQADRLDLDVGSAD